MIQIEVAGGFTMGPVSTAFGALVFTKQTLFVLPHDLMVRTVHW